MTQLPAHSPLGGSGAYRWMACPGSVSLANAVQKASPVSEADDPEYRSLGDTAHAAAATCLQDRLDSWEVIGRPFGKHTVTAEMARHLDLYLSECAKVTGEGERLVEYQVHVPEFHPLFFSRIDFAHVSRHHLDLIDLKYGEGVEVEAEGNPQLLYYAWGLLAARPEIKTVRAGIVQPRWYGRKKSFAEYARSEVASWAGEVLRPAMQRATSSSQLLPGTHCRFCPAKATCPAMRGIFKAFVEWPMGPEGTLEPLSDDVLGGIYSEIEAAQMFIKSVKDEVYRRMMAGRKVANAKLVPAKVDRVWKDGAEEALCGEFGPEAYAPSPLLSPAQIEGMGARGAEFVKTWAYKPEGGLVAAPATDKRAAKTMKTASQRFENLETKNGEG